MRPRIGAAPASLDGHAGSPGRVVAGTGARRAVTGGAGHLPVVPRGAHVAVVPRGAVPTVLEPVFQEERKKMGNC